MVSFDQFEAFTFDCYGTLIDWESGLLGALRPILRSHRQDLSDLQILKIYGELEPKAQNPYRCYREVLANVARGFGERLGFSVSDREAQSLAESLKKWQPFPDTVAALEKLKAKYKLAIISNTDDELFAATARHLQVRFDEVITAEQARAYKPSLAIFRLALERLKLPSARILHVGQSVYHDAAGEISGYRDRTRVSARIRSNASRRSSTRSHRARSSDTGWLGDKLVDRPRSKRTAELK